MSSRKVLSLVVVSVLGLLVLAACGPSGTSSGGAGSISQAITVKGNEFKFEPNNLTFKAQGPVSLIFQNTGTVDHELDLSAMPAKNVTVDLSKARNIPADKKSTVQSDAQAGKVFAYAAAGGQMTVTFTPTQAGTFSYACNLPGHKEAGMTGSAVVQ
jgi:uncharacterized cupredoxin-like copper-binding protein